MSMHNAAPNLTLTPGQYDLLQVVISDDAYLADFAGGCAVGYYFLQQEAGLDAANGSHDSLAKLGSNAARIALGLRSQRDVALEDWDISPMHPDARVWYDGLEDWIRWGQEVYQYPAGISFSEYLQQLVEVKNG